MMVQSLSLRRPRTPHLLSYVIAWSLWTPAMPWEPAPASVPEVKDHVEQNHVILLEAIKDQPAPADPPADGRHVVSSANQITLAEPYSWSVDFGEMTNGCFKLLSFGVICFIVALH